MGLELSAYACEFVRRERERGRDKNVSGFMYWKIGYEENKIISLSLSLSRVYRNSFLLIWPFSRICNSGNFKEKFFEGSKMYDFKNKKGQIIEFLIFTS